MKIKNINEFPFKQSSNAYPDLVFACSLGGMGMSGLIMMIKDDYIYLWNHQNMSNTLYKKLFLLAESYYPELISVAGYGGEVKKRRPSMLELYDYNYLGLGNVLLINKEFARKNNIDIESYKDFIKFIKNNIDKDVDLYDESLKTCDYSLLYVQWSKKEELIDGFYHLNNLGFKWINGDEINVDKNITETSQRHICIDFKNKTIGFLPSRSVMCGVMYFATKDEDLKYLIDLYLK